MNKNVFILEVDCELQGVYDHKQSAVVEAVSLILGEIGAGFSEKDATNSIKELVDNGFVDGWIYIYEKPFYGDLT